MKNKKIISILLASTIAISGISINVHAFKDIENHWAKEAIENLQRENLIKGYDEETFIPDKFISREETAALVDRLLIKKGINIIKNKEEIKLLDIEERWSTSHIKNLVAQGVLSGYPDGKFLPEQSLKRQEFVKIINQLIDPEIKGSKKIEFNDIENQWGEKFIKRLSSLGIINGYEDNSFKPNKEITRAEVAKIINEILKNSNNFLIKNQKNPSKDENIIPPTITPAKPSNPTDPSKDENIRPKPIRPVKPSKPSIPPQNEGESDKNEAPKIIVKDRTIKVGDTLELKRNAQAIDKEDGDISEKLIIEENIPKIEKTDRAKEIGEYEVKYYVEDSKGKKTEKIIKIKVESIDKTNLINKIREIESLDLSEYQQETIINLVDSLKAAKKVEINNNALSEDIAEAIENLENKQKKLKKISSDNTRIKVKSESKEIELNYIDEDPILTINEIKEDESLLKIKDILKYIEAEDGSKQEYKVLDENEEEVDSNKDVYDYSILSLKITAEDGISEDIVPINKNLKEQGPPKNIKSVSPTGKGKNDGKIIGLDSNMEYKNIGDNEYKRIEGNETELTNLASGDYLIRYKKKPGYNPSTAVRINIPKFKSSSTDISLADNREVILDTQSNEKEKNIRVYKVKVDGSDTKLENILSEIKSTDGSNQSYRGLGGIFSDKEIGLSESIQEVKKIEIKSEDGSNTINYKIQVLNRNQDKPQNISSINAINNENGKIIGVSKSMEYTLSSEDNWKQISGSEITDLKPGKYKVRYKEKNGYNASDYIEVEVRNEAEFSENIKLEIINPSIIIKIDEEEKAPVIYFKSNSTAQEIKDSLKVMEDQRASISIKDSSYGNKLDKENYDTVTTGDALIVDRNDGKTKEYTLIESEIQQPKPQEKEAIIPLEVKSSIEGTRNISFLNNQASFDYLSNVTNLEIITREGNLDKTKEMTKTKNGIEFNYLGRDIVIKIKATGYKDSMYFINYSEDERTSISNEKINENNINSIDKGFNNKYIIKYNNFLPTNIKFAVINEKYLVTKGTSSSDGNYLVNSKSSTEIFRIPEQKIEKIILLDENGNTLIKNY